MKINDIRPPLKIATGLVIYQLVFLLFVQPATQATEPWSGILDPSRAIDWSQSGIPGGIPNRTKICATIKASDFGNGSTDATAAIQKALGTCKANEVVLLSAGTFRTDSSLSVPSDVTLRGAGADQTIIDAHGSGPSIIHFGSNVSPRAADSIAITGGAKARSSSITVESTAGVKVGSYLMITELNDPNLVSTAGAEGACTWCDGSMWGGTRVRGQIVEVTSLSGKTVGIAPALYSDYSLTPLATTFSAGAKHAGVEDLQVYGNQSGYKTDFQMLGSAYCWLRNVEVNYADGDLVRAWNSYRGEIRDSYFSNAYSHTSGQTDADVMLAIKTSGFLVENNIFERLHSALLTEWGAAGNVLAYNFSTGAFDSRSPNVLMMDLSANHGPQPQFNLWEGNVAGSFHPDIIHGSSGYNTAFRNWIKGTTQICEPVKNATRAPLDTTTCHWAVDAVRAMDIDAKQLYYNLVGNVVGSAEMAALKSQYGKGDMAQVPAAVYPAKRPYSSSAFGYSWGYGTASDTGTDPIGNDRPYKTAFIHGDYNNVNNTFVWVEGVPHTLAASWYLTAKPSWFGSVPWPAIGPDVSGGIGPGGHAHKIPAQVCYEKSSREANGLLVFNPGACYGSATSGPKTQ